MSVPTQARSAQAEAARPDRSAWVSANAGSGKTRVLTNRVARLLLGRTDPQKILCLTFTNAAAAEMQNRLFGQLGEWAMLPEEALRDRLAELGATREAADGDGLREARRLFARALETPGGLRIQTIHAFCDRLLRRFPLEAGVAPDFTELDPARGRELVDGVLDDIAGGAGAAAFDAVARYLSGNDPGDLIAGILSVRSRFRGPFDEDALRRALGAPAGRTVAGILADVLANSTAGDLRAFCDILLAGSTNDRKAGQALASALGQTDPDRILAGLEKVFLTGGNTNAPYTAKADSLPTKATRAANPDLVARIEPLMRAVEAARDQHLSAAAFARALALNRFAR
ncbi:MAG: UvrD-helicase domain-containing protein, partial [Paracoccaceae bacterium]